MSTVSWKQPVPDSLTLGFRTFIKRKIEYQEGKFAYFTFCHLWDSGEEMLVAPSWVLDKKQKIYSGNIKYDKTNDMQRETVAYYEEHACDIYGENGVVNKDNFTFHSRRSRCDSLRTVKIGERIDRVVFDELDGYFVIRYYEFVCHAPKLGEVQQMSEHKRVFIVDGVIWAEYVETPDEKYFWDEANYKRALNSLLYRKRNIVYVPNSDVIKVLQRNLPNYFISDEYMKWFAFMPTLPKNNKFQRIVDEYNQLVNNDIPQDAFDFFEQYEIDAKEKDTFCIDKTTIVRYCTSQRINKALVIVRLFMKNINGVSEYARLFVDSDNIYPCYCCCGVVSRCDSRNIVFWTSDNVASISIAGTVLEGRLPYLRSRKTKELPLQIICGVENLFVEQMEKLGFRKYCKEFYSTKISVFSFMHRGGYDIKKKNISVADVYTKYELKRLVLFKNFVRTKDDIGMLLDFFNQSGIKNIDFYKDFARDINQSDFNDFLRYYVHCLYYLAMRLPEPLMRNVASKIWKQFLTIRDKNGKNCYVSHELMRYLRDTYHMLDRVYADDKLYYSAVLDAARLTNERLIHERHNTISCLAKYKQYPKERFDTICEKHRVKEYDEGEYFIRLPNDTEEIISEGSKMNHCVGSYIDNVMNGNSVILFMRKKSVPEKPYVTIEVGRNDELYQVKCNSNRCLASEEALAFLTNWAKKKSIKPNTHDVAWDKEHFVKAKSAYAGYYIEEEVSA